MSNLQLNVIEKLKIMAIGKDRQNNFTEEFKNSVANYTNFKTHINLAVLEMYKLMNGHPDCSPSSDFKKEVFAPPGASAQDQLSRGLTLLKEHAWETNFIDRELEFCTRAREVEKHFQKEGHARLKNTRKFLSVEFPKFQILESEAAKLSISANAAKGAEKSQTTYQAKLSQMAEILSSRGEEQKVEHFYDFTMFLEAYADYHDRMAAEHERQTTYFPAKYEQPAMKKA